MRAKTRAAPRFERDSGGPSRRSHDVRMGVLRSRNPTFWQALVRGNIAAQTIACRTGLMRCHERSTVMAKYPKVRLVPPLGPRPTFGRGAAPVPTLPLPAPYPTERSGHERERLLTPRRPRADGRPRPRSAEAGPRGVVTPRRLTLFCRAARAVARARSAVRGRGDRDPFRHDRRSRQSRNVLRAS